MRYRAEHEEHMDHAVMAIPEYVRLTPVIIEVKDELHEIFCDFYGLEKVGE